MAEAVYGLTTGFVVAATVFRGLSMAATPAWG
jgi:hypothetical protein